MKSFIFKIVQQAVSEVITRELHTRIDGLEASLNRRIDGLDERINSVEASLTRRIDGLNERINSVEKNLIERFEARFDSIEKAQATIQGNLEGESRFFHLADYLKQREKEYR